MRTWRATLLAIALAMALSAMPTLTAGSAQVASSDPNEEPPDNPRAQCEDGLDNDYDGKADVADPGCATQQDDDETDPPPDSGGPRPPHGENRQDPPAGNSSAVAPGANRKRPRRPQRPQRPQRRAKARPAQGTGGVGAPAIKGGKADRLATQPGLPERNPDGSPTNANPTLSVAQAGPAPLGVPNFIIDQFEIPPFLLPLYQACGTQYGIPWQVLAAINRIETAFGTNLNVSTAGAVGWMQFLPSTWEMYGVDANSDGVKDPYNPVDAICAAARYLKAAGGTEDLREAIFAYNHADWYVDEVLLYAQQYGKLPDDLVGSLTGLTEGAHFPVAAKARYADDISEREAIRRSQTKAKRSGNAADVISSSPTRRGINIYSKVDAPVVAVNDGVIKKMGESPHLGKFIVLEDVYGNRYTYAQLGSIQRSYPAPKGQALSPKDFELVTPKADAAPGAPASAGSNDRRARTRAGGAPKAVSSAKGPIDTENLRPRIHAGPTPDASDEGSSDDLGGRVDQLLSLTIPGYEVFKRLVSGTLEFDSRTMRSKPLEVGSKVSGGTLLGRIGPATQLSRRTVGPHLHFAIRPAGRGAPSIDPKPILDGWKLFESTAIYRAAGDNPLDGQYATVGQILLMDKTTLERRVLANPRLKIYACGRVDIQTGQIDRRVLAALEYLAVRGYRLTITSLTCGHGFLTSSGNVSAHSSGNAIDIAEVNGVPILGNQGPGTVTEAVIKDLLKLQGTMRPAQIISLMDLGPPTFILADHADHIHVGYSPSAGGADLGDRLAGVLEPEQWQRLTGRLGQIENPTVPIGPSSASLPAGKGK